MWGAISALLTRAGEALGIEVPELPDVTALSDTVSTATDAVTSQAGETSADVAAGIAGAGDTVTGAVDQAAAAAASLPGLAQGKPS
jgi:hypothetical protein